MAVFLPLLRGGPFPLGQLAMSMQICDAVAKDEEFAKFVMSCMKRHASGDWGDLDKEDKAENELSLKQGFRIFSSYNCGPRGKVWVITEADRSATTVLFPEEY